MPEKYHIETKPVPPRRPRVGKYGVVDWREDCARCHNCVKKACVYDRYKMEREYIRSLSEVDALFFDCMGCFSCVQDCTKGLLCLSINPVYKRLGNSYWTPEIIHTTWLQAETAKIPVSGAGYRGTFSGPGFDSMWTDMSEIVRPTRDGIHGREYISTSVDIGRKVPYLTFDGDAKPAANPPLVSIPMPLIIDLPSSVHTLPELGPSLRQAAKRTGLLTLVDSRQWPLPDEDAEQYLPYICFYLGDDDANLPANVLGQTRLVEIPDVKNVRERIDKLKAKHPELVVAVRVQLDAKGCERVIELAEYDEIEVIHAVADANGNEIGAKKPRFIRDLLRQMHLAMTEKGIRDHVTLIAGGGIALAEHIAKSLLCGADAVSIDLPLLVALECHLCKSCKPGDKCPAKLDDMDLEYGAGRMTNLLSAWHNQLIELMGAMGIREARRLRGETGRAMFFEELEEETFGRLFGTRKQS